MDALIMAGHTPGKVDPLLEYAGVDNKALIMLAGKPMIKWVADALVGSDSIERLFIVGQDESLGIDFGTKPVIFIPNQGRMLRNIVVAVEQILQDTTDREHILVSAVDIPLITTSIVDDHIRMTLETQHDIYYTLINRETMLARFPTSRRSYTHMRDAVICGGDLNMLGWRAVETNREFWDAVLESRKSALRQVSKVGLWNLLLFALRRLTIEEGIRRAEKFIGISARAVRSPHAEIGMDIDKPFQLDIVRAELEMH